jgi:hypothetical protein
MIGELLSELVVSVSGSAHALVSPEARAASNTFWRNFFFVNLGYMPDIHRPPGQPAQRAAVPCCALVPT